MRRLIGLFATLLCLTFGVAHACAADLKGWGVVMLHGKGGGPGNLSPVASALTAAGANVVAPRMSWASTYVTYDQALSEVGRLVAALRARGARRIALVGHSLGANVALGYAAQRGSVQAVVAMAPGHQPAAFIGQTGESLARAKALVAAGRGAEVGSYTDVNQGRISQVQTTAAAYASFFDPSGQAVFSRNAGAGGAPVLWVVGTGDPGARRVARGGTIISVSANHFTTPAAGVTQTVAWLEGL
jgi:pimeloyl-ACP methyl ester carboxylesterase